MSIVSEEQLTRLKGAFAEKYGQSLDDWSAMVLFEMQEQFLLMNQQVDKSVEASRKIAANARGNHLHFYNRWDAFYMGVGVSLPWVLVGSILALLVYVFPGGRANGQEPLLPDSAARAYRELILRGELTRQQDELFLILKPAARKAHPQVGREYVYEAKRQRVLVPLGKRPPEP